MGYTIESLKMVNPVFDHEHRLTAGDVEMANYYVSLIEDSRSDSCPAPGDIVEYTTKYGDFYRNAHIEGIHRQAAEGRWSICEQPQVPFVHTNDAGNGIVCSTSGGAWAAIPHDLKWVGKRMKWFCRFGNCGARAHGSVSFQAMVNVWEYSEPDALHPGYSTKEWDKTHVYYCADEHGKPVGDNLYTYFLNGRAFKTKGEYENWLHTVRGVEFPGYNNSRVVFYYREQSHLVSRESWEALEMPLDTRLCNGLIIVKVHYNDSEHLIDVYRFTNAGTLDWQKYREFEMARGRDMTEACLQIK